MAENREQSRTLTSPIKGHHIPKFNLYGQELRPHQGSGIKVVAKGSYDTLNGKPHLPKRWQRSPTHATQSSLANSRKKEFRPHHTFDLDGDGIVSPEDYFYALQFDKDKDGKLNAKEREEALKAISEGYKNKFYHVKVGAVVADPSHRILQRRGKVLREEAGGWEPLMETFSPEETAPASTKMPFSGFGPGGVQDNPDYNRTLAQEFGLATLTDLNSQRKLLQLKAAGYDTNDTPADLRTMRQTFIGRDPLNVTASAKSKTELEKKRKLLELRDVLNKQGRKDEAAAVSLDTGRTDTKPTPRGGISDGQTELSKTQSQLRRRRRREFSEKAKKFAPTKPLGVHEQPLPSFEKTLKAETGWWRDQSHLENTVRPPWSGSELEGVDADRTSAFGNVTGKNGFRVDATTGKPLLATRRPQTEGGNDPFKTRTIDVRDTHEWKKKHQAYVEKPIAIQHFPTDAQKGFRSVPRKTTKRWTDTVLEYRLMQEDNDKHLDARGKNIYHDPSEYAPLYSSFSNDRIFRPSTSVGAVVPKKKTKEPKQQEEVFGSRVSLGDMGVATMRTSTSTPSFRNRHDNSFRSQSSNNASFGKMPLPERAQSAQETFNRPQDKDMEAPRYTPKKSDAPIPRSQTALPSMTREKLVPGEPTSPVAAAHSEATKFMFGPRSPALAYLYNEDPESRSASPLKRSGQLAMSASQPVLPSRPSTRVGNPPPSPPSKAHALSRTLQSSASSEPGAEVAVVKHSWNSSVGIRTSGFQLMAQA